jgi:3-deoxy-7-phosphoheptulonate synthase/chorismate mutase
MDDWTRDPVVVDIRAQISEADRAILAKVNERIELVERLRRHKVEHGYPFLDRAREERLLAELAEQNRGPLSEEGVRELFSSLLALVKRELADGRPAGASR